MNLYILRHGKAEPLGPEHPDDDARPLAARGVRRTKRGARGMVSQGVDVATLLSSPLTRARQTAEIVHSRLKINRKIVYCNALASGDVAGIVDAAHRNARHGDVMLVGHEPTLSLLISLMSSGGDRAYVTLKPGGLCKLRLYGPPRLADCASIEWLLTPKQLAAVG